MSGMKASYDDKQRFFSVDWGKDLFKYPEKGQQEKQPEEERESCFGWFKRFLRKQWLPTKTDEIYFINGGITGRDWNRKRNYDENGFIIRYIIPPYLFQLEHTHAEVYVGVKIIDAKQVENERRIDFALEIAENIFQESVFKRDDKTLKEFHIIEEGENLVWGWWSPVETDPIYDNSGNLIGYDLKGHLKNKVSMVMFQTDGTAVRYEIRKRLPPEENVFGIGENTSSNSYRNIDDLVISEEKAATYIPFQGDRFFDTLWGGELLSFQGEEVISKYPQPSIKEKQGMLKLIKQTIKQEYLPSDIDQHLFYVPRGVKDLDLSKGVYQEKDGFVVRYFIDTYLIQIEKTNSEFSIGVKPMEKTDYIYEMMDRLRMVREVAEEVLRDGFVPKKDDASYFFIKIHNEDLTYGWWKPQDGSIKKIEFLTDGYGLCFEIRNISQISGLNFNPSMHV